MNLLLDTRTFLWWTTDQNRIPSETLKKMEDPQCGVFLSVASSWEAMIKIGLGKLSLTEEWSDIIDREIRENGIQTLPVYLRHTYALSRLPPLHRDPFDRILIAQAIAEGFTLVTADPLVKQYPDVSTLWD
jgi:PIN domain nuclease of toxin-antitoxin system